MARSYREVPRGAALAAAISLAACAGGGGQGNVVVPPGGLNGALAGSIATTIVKIYVPSGSQANTAGAKPVLPPPISATTNGGSIAPQAGTTPPVTTPPPAPGSQLVSINVSGPTTINQTVSVGPNSSGCTPAPGGSTCQLSLSLPIGTYTGTIGSSGIAFTVAPGSSNALNLTLGSVPAALAVVPGSFMSSQNAQGGIDLYGAGKHLLVVEMLDANQNVIVGGSGASFSISQTGGSLPLSVTPASAAGGNLFYAVPSAAPSGSAASLRVSQNSATPNIPCAQSGAVCSATIRVDVKQILAVANAGSNSVTLYVNGQYAPIATVANGITSPQSVVFDSAGDLFVGNQTGSVTVYAPPYSQTPLTITSGVIHPQSLVVDARGNLFVANGNGSNTVTLYSPPYQGSPTVTISARLDDPVNLVLDSSGDLFVVNAAANTVTEYAPPYSGVPTILSKGLNAPSSAALDARGNLFVANLNSTPNSIVEYAPPYSSESAPIATITNGINEQGSIAVISANLFVPNQGANTVTQYSAPYTGMPTTIVGGQSEPVALAIDGAGNLYVANYGNNTVTEYAAPYAPGAWTTIATGVSAPLALALSPATAGGPTLLP
jgi:hypothetical protein